MEKFELKGEYIELIKLLKVVSLCSSGGEAKMVVSEEMVMVDGEIETRKKCKIRAGQKVEFNGETILVVQAPE